MTFIDNETIIRLGNKLDSFKADGGWKNYEIDAYIIEVHSKDSNLYNQSSSPLDKVIDDFCFIISLK